jgi:ADP-ribosylation factor protein 1
VKLCLQFQLLVIFDIVSSTQGFNVETVKYKHTDFTIWDVGGQDKLRPLWRHYTQESMALIWVIDSAGDIAASHAAFKELEQGWPELEKLPVLVFVNKADLPKAESVSTVRSAFTMAAKNSFFQYTCAPSVLSFV